MSKRDPSFELTSPLPMIQIVETDPVAYDASGITVPIPAGTTVNLSIWAGLRKTAQQVRGWLIDTADPVGDSQHHGAADGARWKYVVPLSTPGKDYIFQATLVTVGGGGAETVVASDELKVTTTN